MTASTCPPRISSATTDRPSWPRSIRRSKTSAAPDWCRQKTPARSLSFTAVRNPFDSLVSQYVKMRTSYAPLLDDPKSFVHRDAVYRTSMQQAAHMTFPEWVAARYVGRHVRQLGRPPTWRAPATWSRRGWAGPRHMNAGFLRGAHHVMRFEQLQQGFDEVCDRLGLRVARDPRMERHRGQRHLPRVLRRRDAAPSSATCSRPTCAASVTPSDAGRCR